MLAEALGVPSVQELAQRKRRKPRSLQQAVQSAKSILVLTDSFAKQQRMKHHPLLTEIAQIIQGTLSLLKGCYNDFSGYMTEIAQYYGFSLLSFTPCLPTSLPPLQTA